MFNLVVLTGRLTADPELKTTQSGISVTSFSSSSDTTINSSRLNLSNLLAVFIIKSLLFNGQSFHLFYINFV